MPDSPIAARLDQPDAWWHGSYHSFVTTAKTAILGELTRHMVTRHRVNEAQQLRAWDAQIDILRPALSETRQPDLWHVVFEFTPPRLQRRADVILLHPRAIVVLEFKMSAQGYHAEARAQVEDTALDLQDFHTGSTGLPIIPVLVATQAPPAAFSPPMLFDGVTRDVVCANSTTLGAILRDLEALLAVPKQPLEPLRWLSAPYRAMPGIIDAACTLYSRHNVGDIHTARADADNLALTARTIAKALNDARQHDDKIVLFVTGIPGAGKTLCGLNAAFATGANTTFLTGNPTLVHVLREALVRSEGAGDLRARRQHMEGVIQALPAFRDIYANGEDIPPERVIVIDEAQRSWSETYAVQKSRDRRVRLTQSEPAHLLDAMSRHSGFAAIICLIGNGQEIHDGEGGLAEWSRALARRPSWRIFCADACLDDPVPRQRLDRLPHLQILPGLHLTVAMRALRNAAAPSWVDAVLRGDVAAARRIAAQGRLPFRLVRRLDQLRAGLRHACHPAQRCGLIASAAAKRLRAEGLGAELPHMDAAAVAHWFLDRFPDDIRASDALDTVATQFSIQGLELDHVGLCWGGDLVRRPDGAGWQARRLSGSAWQTLRDADKVANLLNTYRVLLTRARYETLIWVPEGDALDRTRDPAMYDAIAAFLHDCGVMPLTLTQDAPPAPAQTDLLTPA